MSPCSTPIIAAATSGSRRPGLRGPTWFPETWAPLVPGDLGAGNPLGSGWDLDVENRDTFESWGADRLANEGVGAGVEFPTAWPTARTAPSASTITWSASRRSWSVS